MKSSYIIPKIAAIFFLLVACKNSGKKSLENGSVSSVPVELSTQSIPDGKRLTTEAAATYFPASFMGAEKRGDPNLWVSKKDLSTGGIYQRVSQSYSNGEVSYSIAITDYSDDQEKINDVLEGKVMEDHNESESRKYKIYKADNGNYITQMDKYRSGKITKSKAEIRSPRFRIAVNSFNSGLEVPSSSGMLTELRKTNLTKLFELPVPKGEVVHKEIEDTRMVLDCDKILPESVVESICAKNVKVIVNDFEGEHNCNRSYKPDDGILGDMVFILTQYGSSTTAIKAVESKFITMDDAKRIEGLGDKAALTTVGEDLYLSVAHKNYLIELRSYDKGGKNTVCPSLDELKRLAKEVIDRL